METIIKAFENALFDGEQSTCVPVFSSGELRDLCLSSTKIFQVENALLTLEGEFIIVGDLHGNLFDLYRIFDKFGLPPNQKYVFLGDIVDRGDFSLATVTFIFALKCKYPEDVFVIRGNHEFEQICSASGFKSEIDNHYSQPHNSVVFEAFITVFSVLPLAALLNQKILCVHGGIGPKFQSLSQLNLIARPIRSLYGGIADEILWSDPSDEIGQFSPSRRGTGYQFGNDAIKDFLENNQLKLLVRGHQSIQDGCEYSLNGKVLTVFSASNYCNQSSNFSGILLVKGDNNESGINYYEEIFRFEPRSIISAHDAFYIQSEMRNKERDGFAEDEMGTTLEDLPQDMRKSMPTIKRKHDVKLAGISNKIKPSPSNEKPLLRKNVCLTPRRAGSGRIKKLQIG